MEAQIQEATNLDATRIALNSMPDLAEYDMEIQEHRQIFQRVLPRYLRYSFSVLLFTVLETEPGRVCAEIARRKSLSLSAREFRGRILERTRLSLEKVAKIDLPSERLWCALRDLKKIRNCTVHAAGEVERSTDNKHLHNLAAVKEGLSIWESVGMWQDAGRLEIGPSFREDSLRQVEAFFRELYDAAGFVPAEPKVET